MAPSKKSSNGRSPLVSPQSQITAFFGKKQSPSPTHISKLNPQNPNLKSPITQKPLLVIGKNDKKVYGLDVVGKRVKVYWPLDKSWYQGNVDSFDNVSGKHMVSYDDGQDEMLCLSDQNIEWVHEKGTITKKKRLRRVSIVDDDDDDDDWGKSVEKETVEEQEEECGKSSSVRKRKIEKMGSVSNKKSKVVKELKNNLNMTSFGVETGVASK